MIITCTLQGMFWDMGIPHTFYGGKICSVGSIRVSLAHRLKKFSDFFKLKPNSTKNDWWKWQILYNQLCSKLILQWKTKKIFFFFYPTEYLLQIGNWRIIVWNYGRILPMHYFLFRSASSPSARNKLKKHSVTRNC